MVKQLALLFKNTVKYKLFSDTKQKTYIMRSLTHYA